MNQYFLSFVLLFATWSVLPSRTFGGEVPLKVAFEQLEQMRTAVGQITGRLSDAKPREGGMEIIRKYCPTGGIADVNGTVQYEITTLSLKEVPKQADMLLLEFKAKEGNILPEKSSAALALCLLREGARVPSDLAASVIISKEKTLVMGFTEHDCTLAFVDLKTELEKTQQVLSVPLEGTIQGEVTWEGHGMLYVRLVFVRTTPKGTVVDLSNIACIKR